MHQHFSNFVILQDLEYLSEGLEGRSSNPVAVLFDTLLHPDADFGYDYPPVLHWKLEQHNYIPHMVLGKGPPGGAWHVSKNFIPLLRELANSVFWDFSYCLTLGLFEMVVPVAVSTAHYLSPSKWRI